MKLNILSKIFSSSILILLLFANFSYCHVGEHDLISLLSEQIINDPENPDLYFKRASQHRYAGHFERALTDFSKAKSLESDYHLADLGMGLVFLDSGWYKTAEVYLNSFLKESPNHIVGMTSLARSLAGQGKGGESAGVYLRILNITEKPSPEFYIEMADSYLIAKSYSQAIESLDMGINTLGHITSLDQKALDIELQNNLMEQAIRRLDSLIEYSPQKERWLYKKGQLLESQGNYSGAKDSYVKALDHYNSRPVKRRGIPVLVELKKNIDLALDRIHQKL
jgi:tetratricopeptide (TPR) repeat protein